MTEHLKAEKLEAILEGLRNGPVRQLLAHVTQCSACRRLLRAALSKRHVSSRVPTSRILPFGRRDGTDLFHGLKPDEVTGGAREARLETWLSQVRLCARREQVAAPGSVEELVAQPPARRRVLVRNNPGFRTWAVAARLLEASRQAGYDDLDEAEDLARLALELTAKLDPALYGKRLLLDLEARCWGGIANVLRQRGRLRDAEEAFERSLEFLQGSADPLEWARYLDLRGSLLREQLKHEAALESVREATALYLEAGQTRRAIVMRAQEGLFLLEKGAPREALVPLEEAREAIDPVTEPRLAWVVAHNLAGTLIDLGRHVEAHRVYSRAQPLYDQFQDRYSVLRRRWLESLLAAGSGDVERAVQLFEEVRDRYLEAGLEPEAAAVSMDLAAVWASQGQWSKLRDLAAGLVPVLASHNLQPQALLALAFFRRAVEQETATTALVQRVGMFLRRSRHNPGLEFEPVENTP